MLNMLYNIYNFLYLYIDLVIIYLDIILFKQIIKIRFKFNMINQNNRMYQVKMYSSVCKLKRGKQQKYQMEGGKGQN